jgi:hypothetical protein
MVVEDTACSSDYALDSEYTRSQASLLGAPRGELSLGADALR